MILRLVRKSKINNHATTKLLKTHLLLSKSLTSNASPCLFIRTLLSDIILSFCSSLDLESLSPAKYGIKSPRNDIKRDWAVVVVGEAVVVVVASVVEIMSSLLINFPIRS